MKTVLMCRPLFFQVCYQINPWMQMGAVDETKAMAQWTSLVDIYEDLGVKVLTIDQEKEVPDMVFCADQGVVKNGKVFLSSFRYPERRKENEIYEKWFKNYGLVILKLPENVYFEGGGETIKYKDKLFIGTGFRTSREALELVEKSLETEVVGLELIDPRFYHLDTCLFVLDTETAFYFPPAFSQESIKMLKWQIPRLIELKEDEVMKFAANSTVVGKTVIIQKENKSFAKTIEDLGYMIKEIDISEFVKAGGGIHCLVGDLGDR